MIKMVLCYQLRTASFFHVQALKDISKKVLDLLWGKTCRYLGSFSLYSANEALFLCTIFNTASSAAPQIHVLEDVGMEPRTVDTTQLQESTTYLSIFLRIQQTACYAVLFITGYAYDKV